MTRKNVKQKRGKVKAILKTADNCTKYVMVDEGARTVVTALLLPQSVWLGQGEIPLFFQHFRRYDYVGFHEDGTLLYREVINESHDTAAAKEKRTKEIKKKIKKSNSTDVTWID